ncbi:MAG: branched-chain amino acid ABC transporter permease [Alphaproteobacteria bacterium]|nr:branched-chain amino acid ABC transporter permease [Alphaproteobacteria bacterium]
MRFLFRTDYNQDIDLFQFRLDRFWYGMLFASLATAPLWLDDYWISQVTYVAGFSISVLGLMLLAGFTGQVSLGHAAFVGIGAYAEAILMQRGVPFPISLILAGVLSGLIGAVIGLPALRLVGIYLAIATFAFVIIVQEVLTRWESLTGGNNGLRVPELTLFGLAIDQDWKFYYVTIVVAVLCFLGVVNVLRSPTGRAFIAIRDSEIAAQSLGVHLARYKTMAFALSAAITGIGGGLFAHKAGYLSPESFGLIGSINLLVAVLVGGIGSVHGAVFGAAFIAVLPQIIALLKDLLPDALAHQPGLEAGVFGLILVLTILFEPLGIYGRYRKLLFYVSIFPLYKRATFKRQKSYTRTERVH